MAGHVFPLEDGVAEGAAAGVPVLADCGVAVPDAATVTVDEQATVVETV